MTEADDAADTDAEQHDDCEDDADDALEELDEIDSVLLCPRNNWNNFILLTSVVVLFELYNEKYTNAGDFCACSYAYEKSGDISPDRVDGSE